MAHFYLFLCFVSVLKHTHRLRGALGVKEELLHLKETVSLSNGSLRCGYKLTIFGLYTVLLLQHGV